MKRAGKNKVLWMMVAGLWVVAGFAACSASSRTSFTSGTGGGAGGGSADAGDEGISFADSGGGDGGTCPSTCAQLGANCGAVTDTACGGIVMCGTCPTGMTCGSVTHNVCGTGENPDACVTQTCAQQKITCGAAGDGCGGTLQCGSCTLPQSCGGNPAKPGQCGCSGLCAQIPTCDGSTTTITGTVWDPAAVHPLYNALVYIPNNPNDPGLQPFPAGITCDVCGATAAGDPLVSTYSAPNGTFTLSNVPVGATIPLVVQLGRWRRQIVVDVANPCGPNPIAAKTLTMPKTHLEGDIPRIAFLTGGLDPVECVLRKMGVADSEFTNPGGGGHINFYLADQTDPHSAVQGYGAAIGSVAQTPVQSALMAVNGGVPVLNQYDMVILECEGYPQTESASDLAALNTYASAGGRLFASDFAWSYLATNGNFAQAAHWDALAGPLGNLANPVTIDTVSNPKGAAFEQWLVDVGVSGSGSDTIDGGIYPAFQNTTGIIAPTQQWLYYDNPGVTPLHFTFNTPVGASSMNQCGRVVFSDWHAVPFTGITNNGVAFPGECRTTSFSSQETILEFMLFDLGSCVQPYTPICTPKTCAQENIGCGPAGDGCGNPLDCGTCPMGQFCGGADAGQCGTSTTCVPETCVSQKIQCGPAGDGCGHQIDCGNCPTGEICGANGPGQCGKVQ